MARKSKMFSESILGMNPVVRTIVFFDFMIFSAFGLLTPIFAVFITRDINGATVATVGVAVAIYWSVKSVLQIFVAQFNDRLEGETDDLMTLVIGTVIGAVIMVFYSQASEVWHIFALQAMFGVADALVTPPYYAIFSRHVDKGKEAYQWAVRSSISLGGGTALGGVLGGFMAVRYGFDTVFLTIAVLLLVSTTILLSLRSKLNGHKKTLHRIHKRNTPMT